MGKVSPVSINYMVHAKLKADGRVEKPDGVGALFGQTEGLLGSDLELRELQKEGKIGRIEVNVKSKSGETTGEIKIPSSLNKTETTLIAAAIETIEKIGPSEAEVEIEKIEDVRKSKRDYIKKRAGKLLEKIENKTPGSREITENLEKQAREDKLTEYGKDDLPAGDMSKDEIIVVEGRADVINLLKNNVDNVIGMDGTKLPNTIKKVSKKKDVTLFVDGDRGGKLIARNVIDNADIDEIAFAPDGKEVEELSYKEIHSALNKKISVDDFMKGKSGKKSKKKNKGKKSKKSKKSKSKSKKSKKKVDIDDNKDKLKKVLEKVEDSKKVVLLDNQLEEVKTVATKGKVFSALKKADQEIYCLVADRASKSVIKAAEKMDVDNIVANNFAFPSKKVNMVSV